MVGSIWIRFGEYDAKVFIDVNCPKFLFSAATAAAALVCVIVCRLLLSPCKAHKGIVKKMFALMSHNK